MIDRFCFQHRGMIHVGACLADEVDEYKRFKNVIWIEANPALIPTIESRIADLPGHRVFNYAACDRDDDEVSFNIIYSDDRTNPGCSSLLELKKHKEYYPHIRKIGFVPAKTITIDTLLARNNYSPKDFNAVSIDVQGAELMVLKGMKTVLPHVDILRAELSFEELYEGCALAHEIDEYLEQFGLTRTHTEMLHPSWGDGIYTKENI